MSNSSRRSAAVSTTVANAALAWVVRLSDASVSDSDHRAFDAWLMESPAHGEAYADALSAYSAAGELKDKFLRVGSTRSPRPLWRRAATSWAVGTAAALVVAIAFVIATPPAEAPFEPNFTTRTAHIRSVTLDDGTEVTLGARTQMDLRFSDSARRVRLSPGEAFFQVAHDSARPFYVELDDTEVRVVGTQFDVKSVCGAVRVSVREGVVQVGHRIDQRTRAFWSARASALTLTAGQEAELRSGKSAEILPSPKDVTGWREGFISYRDASLCEVIDDANRYSLTPIRLAEQSLGELRVNVSYPTDQVPAMLASLAANFPVDVARQADGSVEVRRKHPSPL